MPVVIAIGFERTGSDTHMRINSKQVVVYKESVLSPISLGGGFSVVWPLLFWTLFDHENLYPSTHQNAPG